LRTKELVRRLVDEVVNARDVSALDRIADGPIARAGRQWSRPFRASFSRLQDEDRWRDCGGRPGRRSLQCSGTHLGAWRGRPPTGRRFEGVDEIYVFRVANGRLAATTAIVTDNLTRMKQLGFEL
jgi:hypothetical protein